MDSLRTAVAVASLACLYFLPLWALFVVFDVSSLLLFLAGHAIILLGLAYQYYSGVTKPLRVVNARPVQHRPWLQAAAEDISTEMDVEPPDVYVGDLGVVNAFVVGRKHSGRVVLSESMLQTISREETKAVLAHEIAHLRSHDTTLMMLGEGLDRQLLRLKYNAIEAMQALSTVVVMTPIVVVLSLLRALLLLPLRLISRRREYRADMMAAQIQSPQTMIRALERVQQANECLSNPPQRAYQVESLCINEIERSLLSRLFGTHPPTERRVEKLDTEH